MFSSGMCTEVFQFDVSSTSGAIIPTSPAIQQHKGNNNRRILRAGHPVSDFNLTKDQNNSNKENFSTTKPFPSMVVSVLTDPREEGSDGDTDGTQSLSRVFIVVLVDGVKYVTYSCVLPRPEEVSHLVTTWLSLYIKTTRKSFHTDDIVPLCLFNVSCLNIRADTSRWRMASLNCNTHKHSHTNRLLFSFLRVITITLILQLKRIKNGLKSLLRALPLLLSSTHHKQNHCVSLRCRFCKVMTSR